MCVYMCVCVFQTWRFVFTLDRGLFNTIYGLDFIVNLNFVIVRG